MASNSVINGVDSPAFSVMPKGITISATTKRYNTYTDLLSDTNPPDLAYVIDASADPTVGSGGAFYRWTGTSWKKMYEEESMDQDFGIDEVNGKLDELAGDVESVKSVATTVEKYLKPVWIPVERTEGQALYEVNTTLGNYFAIRITDADVDAFGTEFEIDFISEVVGAIYSNTIPMDQNNCNIIVDVQVDSPSKGVKIVVDSVKHDAPTRLDVYWNGTKAILDPKVKQITALKNEVAELEAEIEALKKESANIETTFVTSGTEAAPAQVQLKDDEWCVMTAPFVATLPENPNNGDSIHMSIEHGNIHMTVVAPEGTTINGQAKPCLVGVDEAGDPISNISFYFVYNAAQKNWIVL